MQNTRFICWPLSIPTTIPSGCHLHKFHNIFRLSIFLSLPGKFLYLLSILKHSKWGYHLIWCTHKPNIHKPMQSHEQKLPHIWKQVHFIKPYLHLGHLKREPKLEPYLLTPSPPPHLTPIPTNILNYPLSKPLKSIPNLILIRPMRYLSSVQLLYNFWNQIISQSLFFAPNPSNYMQNYHMGRGDW